MPIVDKLPALLREDLESAFEDDLDSIFDVTQLRHSLGQRKRDLEIELKRVLVFCVFFFFCTSSITTSVFLFANLLVSDQTLKGEIRRDKQEAEFSPG